MVILVTMQAQKEAPPDMQCKDKFLLQSVKADEGASAKDITADMVIIRRSVTAIFDLSLILDLFIYGALWFSLTRNQGK